MNTMLIIRQLSHYQLLIYNIHLIYCQQVFKTNRNKFLKISFTAIHIAYNNNIFF